MVLGSVSDAPLLTAEPVCERRGEARSDEAIQQGAPFDLV